LVQGADEHGGVGTVDAAATALVLVDLMPRIVALPTAPLDGAEVLARCRRLAEAFRACGATVVLVRVERPNVAEQPPGSDLVPDLAVPGDVVVVKRTLGAFHGTDLDERLRDRKADTLVLAGLVTNFGVESTGRAADEHGYRVVFVADAMAGREADAHEFATRRIFPHLGVVTTVEEVLAALAVGDATAGDAPR
jgi:nicotinamidase-related amidase